MKNWAKYLVEVLVITFSILAAFWLEQWRERRSVEEQRKEAFELLLGEIRGNYHNMNSTLNMLKEFNEKARVIDYLNGEKGFDGPDQSFQCKLSVIDSIKSAYPENKRIQQMAPIDTIAGFYGVFSGDLQVNFILSGFSYAVWDAVKMSGTLIGAKTISLEKLSNIYNAYQADFGYDYSDYLMSLHSGGYGEFDDMKPVLDATARLERVYHLKQNVVNNFHQDAIDHLEAIIKE